MQLVAPFYHDFDDATRRWTARFAERAKSHLPTAFQAGAYSAVLHYLKAVRAAGSTDGPVVVAKMKALPINDFEMKDVVIRADGQTMRPLLLARVKKPSESKSPYDYLEIERIVPAAEAWRTLPESGCAFAMKN
jgi:branched-chain amino acid transport system substrate-binding protein